MSILYRLTSVPDGNPDGQMQDFERRYGNTYMSYTNPEDERFPVFVRRVRGMQICMNTEDRELVDDLRTIKGLDVILPKVGYYNINGQARYLVKRPQRQWRRSLNSSIYQLLSPEITMPSLDPEWLELCREIEAPSYVNLSQLSHPFFTNVAMSPLFAVARNKGNNFLVYRRCKVGSLDQKKKIITLTHKTLEQEVKDLIRRQGAYEWRLQIM